MLTKNQSQEAPIRILQIVSSLNAGSGVLAVVLNWHRYIDTTQIQFDYLYYIQAPITLQQEIEQLGGNSCQLPHPYRHPVKFLRESYNFFKTHQYHTIHSHVTSLNFFIYPIAKWFGAKNIIQHAHGTKWSDKKLNGCRNYLMLHMVWFLITHKLACSQAAGKAYLCKNFRVINNGIDVEKFAFDPTLRAHKLKELKMENNFLIGNIGRLAPQKNHAFLISIFEEIVRRDSSARLILAGTGRLEENIKSLVNKKQLSDKVLFLGLQKDVRALYQAFDVLCMPSLYEGLPVVGVEAQASGLPGVFSDTITPEVLLLPESCMLSLQDSPDKWALKILSLKNAPRKSGVDVLRTKGFDVRQTAKQMQNFYGGLTS